MSQTTPEQLAERLHARFGAALASVGVTHGQVTVELVPARLIEVCTALRDEADFQPALPARAHGAHASTSISAS